MSRSRLRRLLLAATATALCGGLVAACGSSGATGGVASTGRTITLYNGQHPETTDSLVTAFEKESGIKVDVRSDDEDTLADQLLQEGSNSPADVFYTENSPALQELQEHGLLSPLPEGTLTRTAAKYRSTAGDWIGVSARVSVMIYNPRLISRSQLPTSVLQLADRRYKGKLAFAAGETDFQPIVTSVDRAYGKAATIRWLDGIKANAGSDVVPDNETITDEVNRGEAAFGVINQYYWYRLGAEDGRSNVHSKLAYFAPRDPGYVLDVSSAGVLRSAGDKSAADRFVAFLVSKQGQEIIAHSLSYEYPLDDGVTTAAPETPFDQLQPDPITVQDLGDGSTAISLLRSAGLL